MSDGHRSNYVRGGMGHRVASQQNREPFGLTINKRIGRSTRFIKKVIPNYSERLLKSWILPSLTGTF